MIWLNSLAATAVVIASVWLAVRSPALDAQTTSLPSRSQTLASEVVIRGGERGLLDATGHFVPIRPYSRIVSGSSVTDGILLELCEPDSILSFTPYSAEDSPFRHKYTGKTHVEPLVNLEAVVNLKPDLVLVHDFGRIDRIERLREAGVPVFNLGEMRGLRTLLPNLENIATLLGRPERGKELARRFLRRMQAIAWNVPKERRPRGVYVAVHGDQIYGGTDGTSYHDVLDAAGIQDIAAELYDDWPDYTTEQLLALDPEVVVTSVGMEQLLCRHPGFDHLRACRTGRVVGIHGVLLSHPGLDMLEAAEALFEAVHATEARRAR